MDAGLGSGFGSARLQASLTRVFRSAPLQAGPTRAGRSPVAILILALAALVAGIDAEGAAPAREYRAYVASEAADVISVVRFGP
jgi:hypothetical protein